MQGKSNAMPYTAYVELSVEVDVVAVEVVGKMSGALALSATTDDTERFLHSQILSRATL